MNKFRHFIKIIPVLALMLSCSQQEDFGSRNPTGYFDLGEYFRDEIHDLENRKPEVVKVVLLNGERQEMTLAIQDWEKELSAFIQADIDKPAFVGRYLVDTTREQGSTIIRFEAKGKDLKTRLLQVTYDSASIHPTKVEASMATKNILYKSTQDLVYEPDAGYTITGMQSVKFLKEDHFKIKANF